VALCINKGIVLPDGNKPRSIIKICNPFCGPCAAAHPVLEALAEKYGAELYILFLGDNSEADKRVMVARHFMALYQSREETLVKEAMHWWYSSREKSRELLTEKYPIDNENYEAVQDRFTKMQDWNTKAEITFTPTIYVDGYRLPQMYTIKQLEQLFGYK
ncbi:MAG: DsbA family protein, partial [Ferruginibacter sp.]|nr:DsbA family protein [Ferruginibacter sp.]